MTHQLMQKILRHLWLDLSGQDLIEYALITATIAVAVAGFFPQTIMPAVSQIYSKIGCTMSQSIAS